MNPTLSRPAWLLLARLGAVALILALWQAVVSAGLLPSMVPGIADVASAIVASLGNPLFWGALGRTLLAALAGWMIATVVGVVLGLLIGSVRFLDRSTSILIDFGRSFPALALMPVVIMLLGSTTTMEIVVVSLSALWLVLVQTIYGARRQEAAVADTVAVFRIPAGLRFRRVLLPGAMPFIATGVRISSAISILVAVGVEVISQAPGIGRQITLMQQNQQWDVAFAYLFFTGLVGWGIAVGLQKIEDKLLTWKRQMND